jgi:hypothetical protein
LDDIGDLEVSGVQDDHGVVVDSHLEAEEDAFELFVDEGSQLVELASFEAA